jgi:magnesium-transporting ATPase (P-type)
MYAYAVDRGYSVELARTMTLNTLVVMEIFHLFFIRNIYGTSLTWQAVRGTTMVWATVLAVVLAQFAVTYLPVLQTIFATEAVFIFDGMLIVGVGVALFALLESEKQLRLVFARRAVEEG